MKKIAFYGILLTTLFASVACGSAPSSSNGAPSSESSSSSTIETTTSSQETTSSKPSSSSSSSSQSSSSYEPPVASDDLEVTETFNIMSFNIRTYTGNDTGVKNWSQRGTHVINYVMESNMDVICFQEVKYTQYVDMYNGLKEKYDVLYFPREESTNPEGLMIAYDNTFEILEKDMFWLSSTPDKYGFGFDTQYRRICGNVLLRSNEGTIIDVYSVHLGLGDDTIRKNEIKTVMERRKDSPYPKMIMGDFNAHREDKGDGKNTGECIGYISETFKDSQLVAPETDMVATYNGWKEPTTVMIDYIFVSEGITPKKFDVNQETWDGGNFYSDHFAIDAELEVTYNKKTVKNVKTIDIEGDVEIVADSGSNTLNAKVIATLEDNSKVEVSPDCYYYDLPDTLNAGRKYDVTISLNGYENVSVTKEAKVRVGLQAELNNGLVGAIVNTETHQLLIDDKFVEDKLFTFLGDFDKPIANGKESSFTMKFLSETNSLNDLVLWASNGNCQKISDTSYYMDALKLNAILDITVNGTPVEIKDEVCFEKSITATGAASTKPQKLLYGITERKVIENVLLTKGENVVKFTFKANTDGQTSCWNRTASSMNVDAVEIITKEENVSEDVRIKSIEVTSTSFSVGTPLSNIVVTATLENGLTRRLGSFEYKVEVIGNETATEFYYGKYDIKVTLLEDESITTTKSIVLIDYYCKATKADVYIENDRVIYELRFNVRGYEADDFYFFWSAAVHEYNWSSSTIENEVGIFKFDATHLPTHQTTKRAIVPHLKLTKYDGTQEMYVNGKNANGDILSTDGSLIFENNKTVTLGGKKYYIQDYYSMPTLYIE